MRKIAFCLTSLFFSALSVAQTVGTVSTFETGLPLAGVTVLIAETGEGTTTNSAGGFEIEIDGTVTLVFSHVGFRTETRVVEGNSAGARIDIVLLAETSDMEEIIIEQASMTGGLKGIRGMAGSAHLVSTRSLEQFAQTDVHRALRSVPGVSIQEEDGYGLRPNIGLRGSGSERSSKITLMEDGVLVAPAPYTAPSAYYFPTIGRMTGIEVVKGASQIRFGPLTTGGAVNLLSTPIPQKLSGRLTLLAGNEANRLVHANAGNRADRLAYLFEVHQQRSDGFKRLDTGDGTGFDKSDYLAKVRFSSRPGARIPQSLLLRASYTDEISDETYLGLTAQDFGSTPLRRYVGSAEDQMDADQRLLMARHRIQPRQNLSVVTTAYATAFKRNWYKLDAVSSADGSVKIGALLDEPLGFPAAYGLVTGQLTDGQLLVKANNREYASRGVQSDFSLTLPRAVLDAGARIHYDDMDRFQWVDQYRIDSGAMVLENPGIKGTDSNRLESSNALAAYAQLSIQAGRFSVKPGLRLESVVQRRKDFGKSDPLRDGTDLKLRRNASSALLPGLGITYSVSPYSTAFAGLHKGFAPPGTTEGARPESSLNFEVGGRYHRGPRTFELVGFVSDYANLLGADLMASGGTGSSDLFNGGEALVQGLEVSGSYNLGALTDWRASVPMSFAYTHTRGTFSTDFESSFDPWGSVSAGDELPYLARNQLNVSLGLEKDGWETALSGFWTGATRTVAGQGSIPEASRIAGHFTLDLSAEVRLAEGIRAFGVIRNLTDELYVAARRPAGLRPGMPRSLMAGLRASF